MPLTEVAAERHPIDAFLESFARWELPRDGAWVCAIAVRTPRNTEELIALRVMMLAPGLALPDVPLGRFVNSDRHGVYGITCRLDADQAQSLLRELRSDRVDTLEAVCGRKVTLPDADKDPPRSWNMDRQRQ